VPMSCAECSNNPSKPDCVHSDQIKAVLSDDEWDEYQRQLILGTFKKKVRISIHSVAVFLI
jgi:hypothetical protein